MHSENESHDLATWLYGSVHAPVRIALVGDLGSGKTSFARGFLRAAGWTGRVPSPTFTILNEYLTDPPVYHADLYRIADHEELDDLALSEQAAEGMVLIEWADRFSSVVDSCSVSVHLELLGLDLNEHRRIRITFREDTI